MRAAFWACIFALVAADCYLHNPRGSNNRLTNNNNANTVANANRLFDSQNNNKGGYEVGPSSNSRDMMKYFEGSKLQVTWTNQHECGPTPEDSKTFCDVILQYMCDPLVRDGSTTNTIQETDTADTTDLTVGRHESYASYRGCTVRQRNMGLFVADREIANNGLGSTARITRQNNNVNRRGYECPEERDYYPYWHPTEWRDVAIMTNTPSRCAYYQSESQNVKSKNRCDEPNEQYNNAETCPQTTWVTEDAWNVKFPGQVPAPECVPAIWSRDNHLGNTADGYQASYTWTLPSASIATGYCVFRIRYNTTTSDYDGWNTYADQNGANSPVTQDPYVDYGWPGQFLSLAVNTNQYGRIFQDRSHSFQILPKPTTPTCNTIYNVNVIGKRGDLVQVYPAVQYDFYPNALTISVGDCIHFQWTGSNTNAANTQDGQGATSTDRTNICQIASPLENRCMEPASVTMFNGLGAEATNKVMEFAFLNQAGCSNLATLVNQHQGDVNAIENDNANCMVLNAASPYFDGGLVPFTTPGTYYYMCSRNNNIGWQSQKASITVQ